MNLNSDNSADQVFVVLGAGPSGLATALKLLELNYSAHVIVIEKSSDIGGLSSSVDWEGCKIDYGPHRLSGALPEIVDFAKDLLGSDLREVQNRQKVMFKSHLYNFPFKVGSLFEPGLIWHGVRIVTSLVLTRLKLLFKPNSNDFENSLRKLSGDFLYTNLLRGMLAKTWPGKSLNFDINFVKIRFTLISISEYVRGFLGLKGLGRTKWFYPVGGYKRICSEITRKLLKNPNFQIYTNSKVSQIFLDAEKRRIVGLSVQSEGGIQKIASSNLHLISSIPLSEIANLIAKSVGPNSKTELPREELEIISIRLYCFLFDKSQSLKAPVYILPTQDLHLNRVFEPNLYERSNVPAGKSLVVGDLSFIHNSEIEDQLPTPEIILEELVNHKILEKSYFLKATYFDIPYAYLRPSQQNSDTMKELKQFVGQIQNIYLLGRFGAGVYNNLDHALLSGFNLAKLISKSVPTESFEESQWNMSHKIYN